MNSEAEGGKVDAQRQQQSPDQAPRPFHSNVEANGLQGLVSRIRQDVASITEIAKKIRDKYLPEKSDRSFALAPQNLRDILIVISIIAYLCGWTYANGYFSFFGLRVSNIDLPHYYIFVFVFDVLYYLIKLASYLDLLHIAAVVVVILLVCVFARISVPVAVAGLFISTLYLVFLLQSIAYEAGQHNARSRVGSGELGRVVRFVPTNTHCKDIALKDCNCELLRNQQTPDERAVAFCEILDASDHDLLRLIWEGKEMYYVARLSATVTSGSRSATDAYFLPRKAASAFLVVLN